MIRAGIGCDVHPLKEGLPLVLGGVDIPHEKGAEGHSDGDVVCHAVMDALLGAAGMGDIGTHFPSEDKRFKGASSLSLLSRVVEVLRGNGFSPVNIDCTVILQEPKIQGHVAGMKNVMGDAMGLDKERISIKATTSDFLGFTGEGSGIAAVAVSVVRRDPDHS